MYIGIYREFFRERKKERERERESEREGKTNVNFKRRQKALGTKLSTRHVKIEVGALATIVALMLLHWCCCIGIIALVLLH